MKKFLLMFFAALGLFVFGNVEKADAQQQRVKVFYMNKETCQTGYDYATVRIASPTRTDIIFRGETTYMPLVVWPAFRCSGRSYNLEEYINYNRTAQTTNYLLAFYYED